MKPIWIVPLLAVCGFAQDSPKAEVFGVVGIGKSADDDGSLGKGINGGGGIGYRLTSRLGVEAEANAFRTTRHFSGPFEPFRASGVHVTGNGLFYISRGRAQAYILGGAGLAHVRVRSNFGSMPATPAGDGLVVNAGFGVKAFLSRNFSLRPEVRVYSADVGRAIEAPFIDLRMSLGVGYHW